MQKELSEFYKLSKSDVKYASELLERAFLNWSLAVEIEPNEKIRRTRWHYFYALSIRHLIKYGKAYAPSPKMEGVAIWVHSDYYEMSTWQLIKFGAFKTLLKLGVKSIKRLNFLLNYSMRLNTKIIEEPHYHLVWLGVDPDLQKKGIGSELMHAILNTFSKENMKCLLDTQEKQNVEYYRRFGFKLIHESQFPDVDVMHWVMLWESES